MTKPVRKSARLSGCGAYRFCLSRVWDDRAAPVCWVMLNPSTADAEFDDPTIRRCIAFARQWGAGAIQVVNLFALRSTNPAHLKTHADPVGPGNDDEILWNAAGVHGTRPLAVVAAWGVHGSYRDRGDEVAAMLDAAGVELSCLGVTRAGHPRHPLYVSGATPLRPFPEAS